MFILGNNAAPAMETSNTVFIFLQRFLWELICMNLAATLILIPTLILRTVLQKASKSSMIWLWTPFGIRLAVPLLLHRAYASLLHTPLQKVPAVVQDYSQYRALCQSYQKGGTVHTDDTGLLVHLLFYLWLVITVLIVMTTLFRRYKLRKKLNDSVPAGDRIFRNEKIDMALVWGFLRPAVYLPAGSCGKREEVFVLAHEKAHIARHDNFWKLLAFLLLSMHWFNPFIFLAYYLFCEDLEQACDERALRGKDAAFRADYAETLMKMNKRYPIEEQASLVYIVSLFESRNIKKRIRALLREKRNHLPTRIAIGFAILLLLSIGASMNHAEYRNKGNLLTPLKLAWMDLTYQYMIRQVRYFGAYEGTVIGYSEDWQGNRIAVVEAYRMQEDPEAPLRYSVREETKAERVYLRFSEKVTASGLWTPDGYQAPDGDFDTTFLIDRDQGRIGLHLALFYAPSAEAFDPYPYVPDFIRYYVTESSQYRNEN